MQVAYHDGWRWCAGGQARPPPPPDAWPLPPWFKEAGPGEAGGAALASDFWAGELFRVYEEERVT